MRRANVLLVAFAALLVSAALACDSRAPLGGDGGHADAAGDLAASAPGAPSKRPTLERIIDACVFAVSCGAPGGRWALSPTMQQCLESMARRRMPPAGYGAPEEDVVERWLGCAETSRSCSALHSCYGGTWLGATLCREGGSCQGNKLIAGLDASGAALYLDCGRFDATCVNLPTGALRGCCMRSQCGATPSSRCLSSTVADACFLGMSTTYDCARVGAVCNREASGRDDMCIGATSRSCDPTAYSSSCDGNVAELCLGGRIGRFDCAETLTLTRCQPEVYAPCAFAGSECKPGSSDSCSDEHALRFCLDGRRRTRDCRALGFSRCLATDDGRAECVP